MADELIAVVDDDVTFTTIIEMALTDEGYRTLIVNSSSGAAAQLQASQPALALLDLRMERHDTGAHLLERLRQQPATTAMPIIVCSADAQYLREHTDDLQRQGYVVLPKPFDLDRLLGLIKTLLARSREEAFS